MKGGELRSTSRGDKWRKIGLSGKRRPADLDNGCKLIQRKIDSIQKGPCNVVTEDSASRARAKTI